MLGTRACACGRTSVDSIIRQRANFLEQTSPQLALLREPERAALSRAKACLLRGRVARTHACGDEMQMWTDSINRLPVRALILDPAGLRNMEVSETQIRMWGPAWNRAKRPVSATLTGWLAKVIVKKVIQRRPFPENWV